MKDAKKADAVAKLLDPAQPLLTKAEKNLITMDDLREPFEQKFGAPFPPAVGCFICAANVIRSDDSSFTDDDADFVRIVTEYREKKKAKELRARISGKFDQRRQK